MVTVDASVAFLAVATVALSGLPCLPFVTPAATSASASDYVALEGCGSDNADRLCLAYPDGCVAKKTCTLMVTVRPDPDAGSKKYLFEMAAQYTGYVSVALAEADLMGVDSVVECIEHPVEQRVMLYQSLNKALNATTGKRGNARLPAVGQVGVELQSGALRNGVIGCSFSRDAVTTVGGKTYDLESGSWYLQAAAGNRINNDTSIHHHTEWAVSGSEVKLSSTKGLIADSHGSRRDPPNPPSQNSGGVASTSSSAWVVVAALVAVVSAIRTR